MKSHTKLLENIVFTMEVECSDGTFRDRDIKRKTAYRAPVVRLSAYQVQFRHKADFHLFRTYFSTLKR